MGSVDLDQPLGDMGFRRELCPLQLKTVHNECEFPAARPHGKTSVRYVKFIDTPGHRGQDVVIVGATPLVESCLDSAR